MTEEQKKNRLHIGQQLAEIRKSKGLSLRQLSDMCGVTYQNLNKIENGRYSVGLDILSKICDTLDCQLDIIQKEG